MAQAQNLTLINFTSTRSNADYTYPELGKSYKSSDEIYQSFTNYDEWNPQGLNGFILLINIGTHPRRLDKFYNQLPKLIRYLKQNGYEFEKIDNLLSQ